MTRKEQPDRRVSSARAVFARHSNPWSAWTRWATAPLVLVPVWRRSWRDAALIGVWMAVNPAAFGEPAHERAWGTRAVLGDEQWIAERPMDTAMAVDVAATGAGIVALVAAHQRRALPTAAATAVEMALLMVYWELDHDAGHRKDVQPAGAMARHDRLAHRVATAVPLCDRRHHQRSDPLTDCCFDV